MRGARGGGKREREGEMRGERKGVSEREKERGMKGQRRRFMRWKEKE